MRNFFLFLIFGICTLNSCINTEKVDFDKKLISKMSNEDISSGLPSRYGSISLFAKCGDNKIALTSIKELRTIHSLKYNNIEFSDFLSKALNQKLNISYNDKIVCLNLDKHIDTYYKKNDFQKFLNSYTERINTNLILKSSLTEEEINTISYYLFINNYLVSHDDYIGKYYIRKTTAYYNL